MASKILITTKGHTLDGYTSLTSVKQIPSVLSKIDSLVFNSSTETDEQVMSELAKLTVRSLYYISNSPSDKLSAYFVGTNNAVIRDEVFLEDIELFNEAIEDPDIGKEVAVVGDLEILDSFLDRVDKGENSFTPQYLDLIRSSVGSTIDKVKSSDLEVQKVSRAAVGIFDSLNTQAKELQTKTERAQEALDRLEQLSRQSQPSVSSGSAIQLYPTITYDGSPKAILVKDLGNVPYLVSFMMGLKTFIERKNAGSRVALVVLLPQGKVWEEHYMNLEKTGFITPSTTSDIRNQQQNNVIFINHPLQKTLRAVFTKKVDYFLLLDRTTTRTELLVQPNPSKRTARAFYACQSKRMAEQLKLPKGKVFSSVNPWEGALFTIPLFHGYSDRIQSREHAYLTECSSMYQKMVF